MPYFMFQWTYTDTAVQAMLNKPQDRPGELRKAVQAFGGKVHQFFFTVGAFDGLAIVEFPDNEELRRLPADPHGIGRQPRPDDHDPALARGRPERDAEGEGDANRLSAPRRLRGRRHRGRRLTPPDPPSREFNISGRPTIARTPRGGAGARAGAIRRPGRVDAVNPTSVEVLRRKIGRYF